MNKTSERLQQELARDQANLARLRDELTAANEAVMTNPTDEVALKAAALEKQVQAAEATLKRAQEAAQAEAERMKSPEAKADLKRLDQVIKEGDKLQAEIIKAAKDMGDQFEKLTELWREAGKLGRQYDIRVPAWLNNLILGNLNRDIMRFIRDYKTWERAKEINAMPNQGASLVHPNKALLPTDREKMLKERYPDKKG